MKKINKIILWSLIVLFPIMPVIFYRILLNYNFNLFNEVKVGMTINEAKKEIFKIQNEHIISLKFIQSYNMTFSDITDTPYYNIINNFFLNDETNKMMEDNSYVVNIQGYILVLSFKNGLLDQKIKY